MGRVNSQNNQKFSELYSGFPFHGVSLKPDMLASKLQLTEVKGNELPKSLNSSLVNKMYRNKVIRMEIKTIELLPSQTRVLLKEEMRRKLFSDKKQIVEKLKIKDRTVENWVKGTSRPTLEQIEQLKTNSNEIWNAIENLGWQGSFHKEKLPHEIDLEKIAWMIGIEE